MDDSFKGSEYGQTPFGALPAGIMPSGPSGYGASGAFVPNSQVLASGPLIPLRSGDQGHAGADVGGPSRSNGVGFGTTSLASTHYAAERELEAEWTEETGRRLLQYIGPELIDTRPCGGGKKVQYISGSTAIELANRTFGWNNWSDQVISTKEWTEVTEDTGHGKKYTVTVRSLVRIVLRNGVFKEDFGIGQSQNQPTFTLALDNASKGAVTDGIKRALRQFGNGTGGCMYDNRFLEFVKTVKEARPGFDVKNLVRGRDLQETARQRREAEAERARKASDQMPAPGTESSVGPNDMQAGGPNNRPGQQAKTWGQAQNNAQNARGNDSSRAPPAPTVHGKRHLEEVNANTAHIPKRAATEASAKAKVMAAPPPKAQNRAAPPVSRQPEPQRLPPQEPNLFSDFSIDEGEEPIDSELIMSQFGADDVFYALDEDQLAALETGEGVAISGSSNGGDTSNETRQGAGAQQSREERQPANHARLSANTSTGRTADQTKTSPLPPAKAMNSAASINRRASGRFKNSGAENGSASLSTLAPGKITSPFSLHAGDDGSDVRTPEKELRGIENAAHALRAQGRASAGTSTGRPIHSASQHSRNTHNQNNQHSSPSSRFAPYNKNQTRTTPASANGTGGSSSSTRDEQRPIPPAGAVQKQQQQKPAPTPRRAMTSAPARASERKPLARLPIARDGQVRR